MQINKLKGSSMVQYGIIIGIVIIVLIPIFFIFGDTIYRQFESFYLGLKNKEEMVVKQDASTTSSITIPTKPTIAAGSLGGTADVPAMKCANGSCNIDYGDFILQSIPENYNEFVESHGTSGGTETLINLIHQIASQLEEKGDEAGAAQYKDLANLGHFMATIQNDFEKSIGDCLDSDNIACIRWQIAFQDEDDKGKVVHLPENISHLFPEFREKGLYNYATDNKLFDLGFARHQLMAQDGLVKDTEIISYEYGDGFYTKDYAVEEAYPNYAFIKLYDEIMANGSYSDSMKAVTQELYEKIADINIEQVKTICGIHNDEMPSSCLYYQYDPMTGALVDTMWGDGDITETTRDSFLHPKTSFKTNLNSALICITGKNKDNMVKCK